MVEDQELAESSECPGQVWRVGDSLTAVAKSDRWQDVGDWRSEEG